MKKLFALILVVLFAVSCSEVNEDIIPDPVNPEVEQIDNQQSSGEGAKPHKKPRN